METKTITVPEEIINTKIVVQTQERPVETYRDKMHYLHINDVKVVKEDNIIIHPVEVPIPIVLEKDLPVIINEVNTLVMPVPHIVEKIVPQIEERVIIKEVEVHHEIPII